MFIEVGLDESLVGVYDFPERSVKKITDRYRGVPFKVPSSGSPQKTVRSCMPFFDAMTLGIIIPLPFDVAIVSSEGGAKIEVFTPQIENKDFGLDGYEIATPIPQEVLGSVSPYPVVKIESPYWVRTSRGASSLILSPINHFSPLSIVSGLIDSDKIDTKLKFFVYWTGGDGEFLIKSGTPIAQIIPIKRKKFLFRKSRLNSRELTVRQSYEKRSRIDAGAYKRMWRESKND
jgi:antitoxin (DNA-binding transcriptional repressor) of toxin-antitoxin stability system